MARRREADAVVTRCGGGEGEFARGGALGVDDAVIVFEGFFDGDGDGEGGVGFVERGLGGVLEGGVVACGSVNFMIINLKGSGDGSLRRNAFAYRLPWCLWEVPRRNILGLNWRHRGRSGGLAKMRREQSGEQELTRSTGVVVIAPSLLWNGVEDGDGHASLKDDVEKFPDRGLRRISAKRSAGSQGKFTIVEHFFLLF